MPLMTRPFLKNKSVPSNGRWREQHGVTLIELLVAMLMALVLSFAAFSILEFASGDVSRITERTHADQTARTALEKIMLQLHSACVAEEVNPILKESSGIAIKFVSASGNQPAFATGAIYKHEITYTKATGILEEKTYKSTTPEEKGNYKFSETAEKPTRLLTGVTETSGTPIFQYFRYYHKGDKGPKGETEPPYGELNPTAMTSGELATEFEQIAKVTIGFTLAPEGHETLLAKGHQPVALEDSAVFRLTPSSTASEHINAPCSETP
jgi:prepilin-type N-terminal cleavage/methylation domain-containing protein